MGIIGIVSALTLPNLNSSTGDKERVAKVKKIYQNLNDAYGRAVAVYGSYDTWFINDTSATAKFKREGERITEFMKTSKVCAMEANKGCFASGKVKGLDNTPQDPFQFDSDTNAYKIITADGTSVAFANSPEEVFVDIDGPNKGKYTLGHDVFYFVIRDFGIIPKDLDTSFNFLLQDLFSRGAFAAAWIIRFDNADYLKFKNESGLCPNGTTVTEANPRCK